MRNYKNYKDEDVIANATITFSMAELLRSLGLKPTGGNYNNMLRKLQLLNVNTDHWTGRLWNKNKTLKDWSDYTTSTSMKKILLLERGNKCEKCNITHWFLKAIKLELHHIDGDRTNNSKKNLELLCPNCHSFTNTWRNGKRAET